MKLRHLQILVAVVEQRGISRASEHLNVSQPAVSAAIRSLEDELGVDLFERANSSKGVRPNGQAMKL
ncbi:MAG: LysR family transcriptional regulator, partial [Kiloniellales bacterium]|nr:LysR family transcriptional regulator [Kiloniellales bacterium]